ncbi:hypothetical protein KIPE111705_05590 [Kibdelosporangium persicum]|uniref:hypothetical protein n=1 Tax=Kibdelosporangium persicum TaxID=2698649 RepID=UPI0015679D56|nr:hypothetical protein [Kibdelosporangium persicum]
MILVETLEELVYHYLEDPARPGSAVGKVNAQDVVSHVVQHLAERGVDVDFRTAHVSPYRAACPGGRSPSGTAFP